jgi:DNA-binding GntR family transcriptional regulator
MNFPQNTIVDLLQYNRFYATNRLGYIQSMAVKPLSDSITEQVYRRLRADLLSCQLRPGEKLGISKLQADLGTSLCAVREALARLTSEGFVVAEPQKGFHAAPISVADLYDLTNARVEIESLCLRRAISDGAVEWETRIVAAAHRLSRIPMRSDHDPKRYNVEWNLAHDEFHHSLAASCGNRTLLSVREQLFAKSARYRWLSVSMTNEARDLDEEHQSIAHAALDRDADKACALLTIHIKETSRILAEAMGASGSQASEIGVASRTTRLRVANSSG